MLQLLLWLKIYWHDELIGDCTVEPVEGRNVWLSQSGLSLCRKDCSGIVFRDLGMQSSQV